LSKDPAYNTGMQDLLRLANALAWTAAHNERGPKTTSQNVECVVPGGVVVGTA